ncbi:hypothetical protein DW936_04170 [Odoribacter splanchnicus]|nr:hypothetical protein DW936_04170 [Odoribacter splanchnicus]
MLFFEIRIPEQKAYPGIYEIKSLIISHPILRYCSGFQSVYLLVTFFREFLRNSLSRLIFVELGGIIFSGKQRDGGNVSFSFFTFSSVSIPFIRYYCFR